MMRKLLAFALIVLAVAAASAQPAKPDFQKITARAQEKPGVQALQAAGDNAPDLKATPEVLKSAADVQMAPVTGKPQTPPAVVVLPPVEEPESAYYGGTVKKDAEAGHDVGVKTVRFTGSILKLPFAAVGGVIGGGIGAVRSIFAKDDDDHNNNVGAGFMLGASMVGHFVGKGIEWLLKIPALVVGAVGSVLGGIVGIFHGLFKKSN